MLVRTKSQKTKKVPPTQPQLRYLYVLGYRGRLPTTKRAASRLIDATLFGLARAARMHQELDDALDRHLGAAYA